jgi:type IV pilus assembly protein PilQ
MPATAEDGKPAKSAGSLLKELLKPAEAQESELKPVESKDSDSEPEVPNDEQFNNDTGSIRFSPQGRGEIHVRDRDLALVLQMLSMQGKRNIVASSKVSGKVTADFYGVTFDEALTAILDSNSCRWVERGNFIYVYTKDELSQMDAEQEQLVSKLFHLHYTKAADVKAMVEPLCSKEGKITVTPESEIGIASNAEEAGGDALAGKDCLLVVDYPQNVEAITKVIAQIDVRPKQVLIEATILRAQLNENNALGIDFNLVGGVDFQALNSTSNGITNINVGNLPQAELQNTSFTGQTDFNTAIPDGGLTFGIIKNSVAVFIRALEQVTDVSVLANPKIPALNKQRGEVIVGRRDGYITTTITETVATQTVEFLETGTQLVFRPFIGNDGYVRMEVHPEDSTGGLTAANLPFEQTTEVTTNIIVRDGHTILIGGLFREVTTAGRDQLPLLGNIPIAGVLFRNTRDSTQREEVIILLTIHIIKDNDSVDLAGAEAEEDIERYRVGMRQGLQWYGRERLAQAHYRWALDHLAKGHMSKAMWDLDLAINNNPKFMAAIKLKEKLLDGHQWDDDSSSVRGFLMDLIMQEQGLISPIFGWPGPPFEYPLLRGPGGFDQGKDADAQTFLAPSPEAELPPSDNAGKGDS